MRAEWRQDGRRHPHHAPRANTSPEGHAERARPAAQTVHPATARGPNCASGDNERPETAPGCRRMHSLSRGVSPHAQSGRQPVAGTSVLPATRRRDASLAGEGWQTRRPATAGWQTRRPATAGRQTRRLATAGRQTRRPATAGARFRLLPVAGTSVWPPSCRRDVSLACGVSPGRQSASRRVAGCTVWSRTVARREARARASGSRLAFYGRTERSERRRTTNMSSRAKRTK